MGKPRHRVKVEIRHRGSSPHRSASTLTFSIKRFLTVSNFVVICAMIVITMAVWSLDSHSSVDGLLTNMSVANTKSICNYCSSLVKVGIFGS